MKTQVLRIYLHTSVGPISLTCLRANVLRFRGCLIDFSSLFCRSKINEQKCHQFWPGFFFHFSARRVHKFWHDVGFIVSVGLLLDHWFIPRCIHYIFLLRNNICIAAFLVLLLAGAVRFGRFHVLLSWDKSYKCMSPRFLLYIPFQQN